MGTKPTEHDRGLLASLETGDAVRDRKRPAPWKVGTVTEVLEASASEFHLENLDRTVAEDNPDYPADDPVVRVKWTDEAEATIYHFPRSRLVLEADVRDVPPENLTASPRHDRSFDVDENTGYIGSVRDLGYVQSVLTARETPQGLELVDGHKRRWVAERAGLETVAVWIVDLDDTVAAKLYDACHRG